MFNLLGRRQDRTPATPIAAKKQEISLPTPINIYTILEKAGESAEPSGSSRPEMARTNSAEVGLVDLLKIVTEGFANSDAKLDACVTDLKGVFDQRMHSMQQQIVHNKASNEADFKAVKSQYDDLSKRLQVLESLAGATGGREGAGEGTGYRAAAARSGGLGSSPKGRGAFGPAAAGHGGAAPNSGRGGVASTSGFGASAVDHRAVVLSLPVHIAASQAVCAIEQELNSSMTIAPEVGRFCFKHVTGLGKVGEEMRVRAEAASASGAADQAAPQGGSGGATAPDAAAAPSSGGGATAQAGATKTTYRVVAWFMPAWADGSGWEAVVGKVKQMRSQGRGWEWQVKDFLTYEGMRARQAMQPSFNQLKETGQEPHWRNGAEIWTRPGGPRTPLMLHSRPALGASAPVQQAAEPADGTTGGSGAAGSPSGVDTPPLDQDHQGDTSMNQTQ